MARSLPPLGWFRSFEAAARHLNFTAAAQELALTQSAVSQQVRALETRLGVQLFLRRARGLEITDDGRKLLPQVGAALETLEAAARTFDTGSTQGLLTIATSVSVSQWLLAPRIHDFLADHPGLRVRFLSTIWPDDFKASIADVEIRFGSEKQVGAGAERLLPDDLIAVSAHSVSGSLSDQVLIEAVGTTGGWHNWAKAAGLSGEWEPSLHVDSYGLALDLAVNGKGVALTSSLLAGRLMQQRKAVVVHPYRMPNPEGYFIAVNATSSEALAFRDWLTDVVRVSQQR
ncbi:MAG: LysR family transcriptional regulator [Rhodobacteraceae bacterium]|nr:LysR family transcriptional regulator [Paracoccaceae bacterium]